MHPDDRQVHFTLAELKHNHSASFDPFFISFATLDDIESFDAECVITAREPIDPISCTIHFDMMLATSRVIVTASTGVTASEKSSRSMPRVYSPAR